MIRTTLFHLIALTRRVLHVLVWIGSRVSIFYAVVLLGVVLIAGRGVADMRAYIEPFGWGLAYIVGGVLIDRALLALMQHLARQQPRHQ